MPLETTQRNSFIRRAPATLVALLLGTGTASAQIKIAVDLSTTGPAASLGIPEKNTVTLFPKEIGGVKIEYLILDDASDTTTAAKNARRFIDEDKVDVIIGSTIWPNSLAMIDVAAEKTTPLISIAGASRIVEPMDAKRKWVFKTPQHDSLMTEAMARRLHLSQAQFLTRLTEIEFESGLAPRNWMTSNGNGHASKSQVIGQLSIG